MARWVYGVMGGLPRRASRSLALAASSASARISTTDGSTQAFCPGQSGTVQRRQGGKVSGASTQRRVSSPYWRIVSMSAVS